MISVLVSLVASFGSWLRSRAALQLELIALRHQLQVLNRSRPRRLQLATADRCLWAWLSRSWPAWRTAFVIVKPETVIAWHRQVSACSGRGKVADASDDRRCRPTYAH